MKKRKVYKYSIIQAYIGTDSEAKRLHALLEEFARSNRLSVSAATRKILQVFFNNGSMPMQAQAPSENTEENSSGASSDQNGPGRPGSPYFPLPGNTSSNGNEEEVGREEGKLAEPGHSGSSRSET